MGIQGKSVKNPESPQRCKLTTGRPLRSSPSRHRCRNTVDLGCRNEDCRGSQQSRVASPSCGRLHGRGSEIKWLLRFPMHKFTAIFKLF